MMKIVINIILLAWMEILNANRLPENEATFNRTHIFFRWEQIPKIINYDLYIQNLNDDTWLIINTEKNSFLLTEFIDWNLNYEWHVCGNFEDDSEPLCNEIKQFSTYPLPEYYPNEISLSSHDASLAQDGVTVMDFESKNCSGAIDQNGMPILFIPKENFEERFVFTQFLKNGNMVGFGTGKGYEIDLDGNIVFETPDYITSVHHDFNKSPRDTYFFISAIIENQACPQECNSNLPDIIPWQGDIFMEINKYGNEIWSWNTFDHFSINEYNPYYAEIYNGWGEMDWTHSNSVTFDENSGAVFISARNLSRITKIDYETQNVIWNMGATEFMNETFFQEDHNFSQQHSVQILDNGNLLFFDNHRYLTPELSRCLEIEYDEINQTSEIIWQHELPMELFSGSRGECDRLENGNTLITAGRSGNTLEVTPNNETVWQINVSGVTSYRSTRLPSLHPIAFSLTINELMGEYENPQVEIINGNMTINIHNHGWSEGWYTYTLGNHIDSTFIYSHEDSSIDLNLNSIGIDTNSSLNLEVFPSYATNKNINVELNFSLPNPSGDINEDGIINILDLVTLANSILEGNNENISGDLNQDGNQNILDIVLLINIILGDE